MQSFTYEEAITLQENTFNKLILYIDQYLGKLDTLDSIDFNYPDFDEKKTATAFDSWISIDYKTKEGITFISHILGDSSASLSFLEKNILKTMDQTYMSLYEVIDIKNNTISVYDLLNSKKHKLVDPKSIKVLKKGDLIFSRLLKISSYSYFIGGLSFLPPSVKNNFIKEVFYSYNIKNTKNKTLDFINYLKTYTLDIFSIYTKLVYQMVEEDEKLVFDMYDDIHNFEDYMIHFLSEDKIDEYSNNLINFFENYFVIDEIDIKNIDRIDFDLLFKKAIKNGFILNRQDLLSYIKTFKYYGKYLICKDKKYKSFYEKIINISKNRFLYFELIDNINPYFNIDYVLSRGLRKNLTEKSFSLLMDYEKFIYYILEDPVGYKNNQISTKDYQDLIDIFQKDKNIKDKLQLFLAFSLSNKILVEEDSKLEINKTGEYFLRLRDEDKFSALFNFIWSKDFFSYICTQNNYDTVEYEYFFNKINYYIEKGSLNSKNINILSNNNSNFFNFYGIYLNLLDIVDMDSKFIFNFTSFGDTVFKLFSAKSNHTKDCRVINFNTYQLRTE